MRANRPIRVLIFTKYTLLCLGIKSLLKHSDLVEVTGEAATSAEATALLRLLDPDVILMDPITSDPSGADLTRSFKQFPLTLRYCFCPWVRTSLSSQHACAPGLPDISAVPTGRYNC
jgi:DNA-binding NarL/FixJ family response regulator